MALSSKLVNLILLNVLITALCAPLNSAIAAVPYFTPADFGECIAALDRQSGLTPSNSFFANFNEIQNRSRRMYDEEHAGTSRARASQFGFGSFLNYSYFRQFHSLSLVNRDLHRERIEATVQIPYLRAPQANTVEMLRLLEDVNKLANSIVEYLSDKPRQSVSHIELLREVTRRLDGDVLSALGVIGHIFNDEADHAIPRNKKAFLALKMKPLLIDDVVDPVGYNYHFWGYLNLSIQGFDIIANYQSQQIEEDDIGDRAADVAGIRSGTNYRQKRRSPRAQCRLN